MGMKKAAVLSILLVVVQLAVAVIAEAQQPGKAVRIGYLDNSTAAGSADLLDDFRKRMIQLNWIEGKNLTIEYRRADAYGDLPILATHRTKTTRGFGILVAPVSTRKYTIFL
jgi:hypothetical protein